MSTQKALSVVLSQEELFVILAHIGAKELLGLSPGIFQNLNDDQIALVSGVAERALIARDFLQPRAQGVHLHDVPHALVRTCTNPEFSLLLNCHFPNSAEQNYYFHLAKKMIVLHTVPITAIHQFIALQNHESLLKAALSALQLDDPPTFDPPYRYSLSNEYLEKLSDKSLSKSEKTNLLKSQGWEDNAAREFSESASNPTLNHSIVFVQHLSDGDSHVDGFSLLAGQNALWMMYPESLEPQDNLTTIISTTPQQVATKLKSYFA